MISWLNAHTPSEYAFFGIEVSAVRIADSPVAPVFTVVEKPNSWVRSIQQQSRGSNQEIGERNRTFWNDAVSKDQELEGIYPEGVGPYASNHWIEIPGTSFILSVALTRHGVGWFIRGQLGSKDEETAALLGSQFDTLKQQLNCEDNKPYLSRWLRHDWTEPGSQATMIDWLIDEKEKVMNAFNQQDMAF